MKPPTKMSEEIEQLLKNLGLRCILEIYEEQLRAAEKEDITYSELFVRLLRAQWHARQQGALEWRIRRATLPERWSLETFPWTRQPGVSHGPQVGHPAPRRCGGVGMNYGLRLARLRSGPQLRGKNGRSAHGQVPGRAAAHR